MSLINKTGTFRGNVVDSGLAKTKNGYPQYVVQLRGEEYYDTDTVSWVDWSGVAENEITAFLVLFGSEQNATLNCRQLEKAIGWDGNSFSSLLNIDTSDIKVQFRVEESLYNEKISLKVVWIDHYDAEPGKTIQKLDTDEVKALDATYAVAFRKIQTEQAPVKPVSAPVLPNVPAKLTDEVPTKTRGRPKKTQNQDNVQPDVNLSTPPPTIKKLTKQTAWEKIIARKPDWVDDDKLAEIWIETIANVAPGGDEDQLTPELWGQVADIACKIVDEIKF